ncbi:MAG: LL-diaminopimelate aminotransferase [Chloroflexi bacterium]|nr:LL-diaminopimelate aminotransferase [Chloroflexota bacterium]
MKLSRRLDQLKPYVFVEISRIIAKKRAEGVEVVTFGIGDPDIPTPAPIVDRLVQASRTPANHRYPETDGLPEVRRAIAAWYKDRFGVSHLNPDTEVLPLIGAKEGIGHVAFCFLDPGDIALVPDPAYPVYSVGTMFAGAESYTMPLVEKNGWLPELDAIPHEVARDAKVMWLNYPNNPTGAVADGDYYRKAIAFAREYDIALLHDAAYSEVVYDGYKALSFMEMEGAKEVGIEFHSLSKCFNMTGWRFGSAVGNADMIQALFKIKSNLDSGIPQAIQEMAIEALTGPQKYIDENNAIYQVRRDKVIGALNRLGLRVVPPKASLYLWARVPEGYTSASFAAQLLDDTAIVVTPGSSYGDHGEGYIRLSLTTPDEMIDKGVERLASWRIPTPARG